MKKATNKAGKQGKADFLSNEPYAGVINRDYEGKSKFSVSTPGEKSFEIYTKRTVEQLRQRWPKATVSQVRY